MISTPTGTLFEGFSYDPNSDCAPDTLDETVTLAATNNLFSVTYLHSVESWQNLIWALGFYGVRDLLPEDFDVTETDFEVWLAEFIRIRNLVVAPLQAPDNIFREGLARRSSPKNRFKDVLYFAMTWTSFRKSTTLNLSVVEQGSPSIAVSLVVILETPFPFSVGPGRSFYLGVQGLHGGEAFPTKNVLTGVIE